KSLNLTTKVKTVEMTTMLSNADAISLHIPNTGKPVLSTAEFDQMKDGVVLINASRGGTVDEDAMLDALNTGKVRAAGLDVFVGEPKPREDILSHANVSSTPHIGASTVEAQIKIGQELAQQIIDRL
ncbi:MAG: 3-phosphoglycerate dehydrogenase, partial [Saprospiraceae bacterium]|nr:3-phosphoglycerate dehydrogenase [Saprospiraceae bacterium]